jgi:hypothetical protein
MKIVTSYALFMGAFLCTIGAVNSLIHHLSIHNDDRTVFKIETFGFVAGGKMKIDILDFSLHFTAKELDDYKQVVSTTTTNHTMGSEITLSSNQHKNSTKHASTSGNSVSVDKNLPVVPHNNIRRRLEVTANVTKSAPPVVKKPTAGNQTVAVKPPPSPKGSSNHTKPIMLAPTNLVGFVMRHATSESAAQADLESIMERRQCILEKLQPNDVFIDLSLQENWNKRIELTHVVTEESIGLYSLIYARCYPAGHHFTSFKLDATFHNPGPNYLSAGDTPLPSMYFGFFALFTVALVAWVWVLHRGPSYGTVHRIHHMMLILLVLKCLSLFFEGVRFHYISIYGVSEMWSTVYYVFAFMKGIMLFTVILLIGSGWSLMKSYLNDNEKRIVWVVLVLQVLDNIAMIVLEESAPGSQGWLTWRDILHLVDIVCCCAILLPIVWSIRHLRFDLMLYCVVTVIFDFILFY